MSCSSCGVFLGDPCPCCRTYRRIGWILQTCHLAPVQESEALRALRECCCVLTDLWEAAGRVAPAGTLASGDSTPLPKKEPKEEVKEEESKEAASSVREVGEPTGAADKSKKDKKDKKKSHKRDRSEDKATGDGPPGRDSTRERKASRIKQEEAAEEESEPAPRTEVKEETDISGRGPVRGATEAEDLQDRVDSYVISNPRSFELGTLPARGRGDRDEGGGASSGSRRPAEPDHPPPPSRVRRDHDEEIPRRPARPPKKNKGRNHRLRGWERGYTARRPR